MLYYASVFVMDIDVKKNPFSFLSRPCNVSVAPPQRFTPDQARLAVESFHSNGGGPTVSPWTFLYEGTCDALVTCWDDRTRLAVTNQTKTQKNASRFCERRKPRRLLFQL